MLNYGEDRVAKRWAKRRKLKNILRQNNHYEVSPRNSRFTSLLLYNNSSLQPRKIRGRKDIKKKRSQTSREKAKSCWDFL